MTQLSAGELQPPPVRVVAMAALLASEAADTHAGHAQTPALTQGQQHATETGATVVHIE